MARQCHCISSSFLLRHFFSFTFQKTKPCGQRKQIKERSIFTWHRSFVDSVSFGCSQWNWKKSSNNKRETIIMTSKKKRERNEIQWTKMNGMLMARFFFNFGMFGRSGSSYIRGGRRWKARRRWKTWPWKLFSKCICHSNKLAGRRNYVGQESSNNEKKRVRGIVCLFVYLRSERSFLKWPNVATLYVRWILHEQQRCSW